MRKNIEEIIKAMEKLGLDKIELSLDSLKRMLSVEKKCEDHSFAYILETQNYNTKFISLEKGKDVDNTNVIGVVRKSDELKKGNIRLSKKEITLFQEGNKYLDVYEIVKPGQIYLKHETIEVWVY